MQGIWIKGIIDELAIDELGRVKIVEHKTRKNSTLPTEAQKQTARLQVLTPDLHNLHKFHREGLWNGSAYTVQCQTAVFSGQI